MRRRAKRRNGGGARLAGRLKGQGILPTRETITGVL